MVAQRNWKRQPVICAECNAPLMRIKYLPQPPYDPIKHFFCDRICKGLWQKRAKLLSREELIDLYVTQHKDCVQIGKLVKRDPKSIWSWLKDYKIETRGRGSYGNPMPSPFKGMRFPDRQGENSPAWKGGVTPERNAFYASDEWKRVVRFVYGRAKNRCERCGALREWRGGFHVHHIISFEVEELRAKAVNLVVICNDCHYFIHSKDNVLFEYLATPIESRRIMRGRPKGSKNKSPRSIYQ